MLRPIRRFPRAEADALAYVKILGQRRQEQIAWVRMLGAGGCMLVTEDSLGYRSLMELRISLASRELRADGRVAWEARQNPRELHVGIEFIRIGQADRVAIERLVEASGAAA